jgi:uncharacterized membrane protein YkoI
MKHWLRIRKEESMKAFSQFLAAALLGGAAVAPLVSLAASPDLEAEAKVTKPEATRTALSHVKGGTVRDAELEREHGRLVWSFDIAESGGITEVQVDAISGAIVSRKHESAAAEAREAKAEAATGAHRER